VSKERRGQLEPRSNGKLPQNAGRSLTIDTPCVTPRFERRWRVLATVVGVAAVQACATESRGIQLPSGDAARGRTAFVELRCQACHEIEGFDAPTPIRAATRVLLGGRAGRVESYDDLVTSIAHPSHRLARGYPPEAVAVDGVPLMSLIRLNEVMTVQQLVDLAAFLQTAYDAASAPLEADDLYEPPADRQPPAP
jgi:hypothetical protein